jgi:NADH-ubiquinone oxidoreductase chain 3
MTKFSIFVLIVLIVSLLLLSINFIFGYSNPYMEKKTAFECGFHSFLGQNRTQFTISFFIFALLFLLFDLEILLVYPYTISAYDNNIYGLIIMLLFFILLTAGLVYELGKKALKIYSKQISNKI